MAYKVPLMCIVFNTGSPAELSCIPEPPNENYYCGNHDHWGVENSTCPQCGSELVDCHELGILSPHAEWNAAQLVYKAQQYYTMAKDLEDEFREVYEPNMSN